jgi:hypothetical protein
VSAVLRASRKPEEARRRACGVDGMVVMLGDGGRTHRGKSCGLRLQELATSSRTAGVR